MFFSFVFLTIKQTQKPNRLFFLARARCLSAGLRYLRLARLPRHDHGPVPGGIDPRLAVYCTVLRRALYQTQPNTQTQKNTFCEFRNRTRFRSRVVWVDTQTALEVASRSIPAQLLSMCGNRVFGVQSVATSRC